MVKDALKDQYGRQEIEIIKSAGVNAFYGHSSIIRRYSGYSINKPLPCIIQHGTIGFSQDFYEVREWHNREIVCCYWAWNYKAKDEAIKSNSPLEILELGAPFLYFLKLVKQFKKSRRLATAGNSKLRIDDIASRLENIISNKDAQKKSPDLVFAPHSLPNRAIALTEHIDFAEFLQSHEGLACSVVCLHPYDVYLGNHTAYKDSGFEIVCCMDNAIDSFPWEEGEFWKEYQRIGIEYMLNLYSIIKFAKHCYFVGLSTPVFYAGFLMKRCQLITFEEEAIETRMQTIRSIAHKRPVSYNDMAICRSLNELLHKKSWTKNDRLGFKAYCGEVLGASNLISKKGMKVLLDNRYQGIKEREIDTNR